MKKSFLCLFLIVALLLTGCSDRTFYFNYDEMVKKVVKVEVVEMDGLSLKHYDRVLKTIDQELIDDFVSDLSEIKFIVRWAISNRVCPKGICFCLTYIDGTYDIVDDRSSTNLDLHCDTEQFNELLNKYY
ncbi:MAG: hypothetical protein IJF75_01170 [Clostridia bacterium]|nr:hypothetical protein [Clostridia bacterium]